MAHEPARLVIGREQMSYAFDSRAFVELVNETERLATFVRDHESRLSRLAADLDDTPSPALDAVRALCADARVRRNALEALLGRVLGSNGSSLASSSRPRVLIADDSDDNRELTANLLDVSGFFPIATRNGLEALMAANCLAPAVVLMDVSMPILDGIETARLLRASTVTRQVPVIAHTAWPSFFDGPGRDLFAAVLPKPTTPEALLASVQRFADPSAG